MTESSTEQFEFCGDVGDLPQSFYMALARLLLAAHEGEKVQSTMDVQAEGDEK